MNKTYIYLTNFHASQSRRIFSCLLVGVVSILFLFATPHPVLAKIIVHPNQSDIAQTIIFDTSVSSLNSSPTTGIRLLIPDTIVNVLPNVKSGWSVSTKKSGNNITEIDWTGGNIPTGERDDFYFAAQVPAKETTIRWKAYQEFANGTVIAWIHAPTGNENDDTTNPPYSTTQVINYLKEGINDADSDSYVQINFLIFLSVVTLCLSVIAIYLTTRKK